MSLLNLSLFQKKNIISQEVQPFSGFILHDNQNHDANDTLIHCFVKGTIICSATFGAIHGILTEFDISYNYALVFAIIFLASMALSFMHMNKWIFNIGYPLLFILFASSLFKNRTLANSGFQAFINIFNEAYSKHFLLNFTRESTELVSNRFLSVTTTSIFVGIFIAILVNVAIFHDMYYLSVFNFTFWPLQLGIYIGQYPSYVAFVFVFYAYFATCFLKLSGHYHFIGSGKKKTYHFAYQIKEEAYIFHKSNARTMAGLCTFAGIIALFFSIFCSLSVKNSETESMHSGALKSSLDENVKILVQSGISGMFNRYEATGGISAGKLGGIRSVRPDYETDLIATFVPYAYERIYLKSYTGAFYTSTEWMAPTKENGYIYSNIDENQIAFTESKTMYELMNNQITPLMSAKMLIENVGASTNYQYLPYFVESLPEHSHITKESTLTGISPLNRTVEVSFIPYSVTNFGISNSDSNLYDFYKTEEEQEMARAYKTEAYNNYLSIPMSIQDEIDSYHELIGESPDMDEQITLIRNFLYSNYTYDMSPGSTPYNKDYVTYFLGEQKRGYCAHFATAATLLLRSYGIPARYVEGYVIDQSDIAEKGKITDYSFNDFFTGTKFLTGNQIISVEIPDGNAHAWTEVYIDNFGWIPVDMTPPSTDKEEISYNEFLSALSGLLSGNMGENQTQQIEYTGNDYSDLFNSIQIGTSPVFICFLITIFLVLSAPITIKGIQIYFAYRKRHKDYCHGIYKSSIAFAYRQLKNRVEKYTNRHGFKASIHLPEDLCEQICDFIGKNQKNKKVRHLEHFLQKQKISINELFSLTQQCIYSNAHINKKEADVLIEFYRIANKMIS
ncbi:MAG: transglutaminase domain-containing protein [Lachnospiraceae bacterium]|nr:transglutaminase domain-containing protein [Lachnospiraceae bacterium]